MTTALQTVTTKKGDIPPITFLRHIPPIGGSATERHNANEPVHKQTQLSATPSDLVAKAAAQLQAMFEPTQVQVSGGFIPWEPAEHKFRRLADEWRQGTRYTSSGTEVVTNSAYQRIIGMGREVLPILFRELETAPDDWFWALYMITEENPVKPEDAGDIEKMAAAWLAWARDHRYQW
jgi:hypothetical protein